MAKEIDTSSVRFGIRREAGQRISGDKFSLFIFIFFMISILVQSSLILINWSNLPPEIPIFYSRPWGEPMLAAPVFLWILPGATVVFVLVNYLIALYFLRSQYFLNRVLTVFSAIISFATLYDVTRIIGLLV